MSKSVTQPTRPCAVEVTAEAMVTNGGRGARFSSRSSVVAEVVVEEGEEVTAAEGEDMAKSPEVVNNAVKCLSKSVTTNPDKNAATIHEKSPGSSAAPCPDKTADPSLSRSAARRPVRSATMCPGNNADKCPSKSAAMCPGNSAGKFRSRNVSTCPGNSVKATPGRSAGMCPDKSANRCPGNNAGMYPSKSAATCPVNDAATFPSNNAEACLGRSARTNVCLHFGAKRVINRSSTHSSTASLCLAIHSLHYPVGRLFQPNFFPFLIFFLSHKNAEKK